MAILRNRSLANSEKARESKSGSLGTRARGMDVETETGSNLGRGRLWLCSHHHSQCLGFAGSAYWNPSGRNLVAQLFAISRVRRRPQRALAT